MAVESIALALHHSKAKGATKLVLLGIANHDGDGGAWPSVATLSKYAGGIDGRSVRRSIAELVRLGEVSVQLNAGGTKATHNDRRPNLYHFLLRCPEGCDGTKEHRVDGGTQMSSREHENGASTPRREDVGVRHGRTHTSPEPSIEPVNSPFVLSDAVGADVEKVDSDARIIARKACDNLAVLIAGNDPHGKAPNVTEGWVTEMERLHRIDGRPWPDIKTIIEWSQTDPFWLANIKSPAKLRKHFPALANARDRKPRTTMDAGRDVDAALAAREATPTEGVPLLTRGHGSVLVDA